MFNLKNKVSVVTGAAQGLGEAIANRLDEEGCYLVLADINLEKVKKVAKKLKNALSFKADVTNEEEVENLIKTTIKTFKKLDILVCNAGIIIAKPIIDFSLDEWKKVVDVNLIGYFLCAKAAARVMIPRKNGNIIQINSKSGKRGSYKNSAYAASKFGGIGFTQSLALELAEFNIRVNAICPGNLLDSPLWVNSLNLQYSKNLGLSIEETRRKYLNQIPSGRSCSYNDVTNLLIFLASDQSNYLTGLSISVTGGVEFN